MKIRITNRIAFKSIVSIVLILAVFAVAVIWIGYNRFSSAMSHQYTDVAFQIADAGAKVVKKLVRRGKE